MYLFVHYPTDTIGEIIVSHICSKIVLYFFKPVSERIIISKRVKMVLVLKFKSKVLNFTLDNLNGRLASVVYCWIYFIVGYIFFIIAFSINFIGRGWKMLRMS